MFNEHDSAVIKMIMNLAHQILQHQLMNKGPPSYAHWHSIIKHIMCSCFLFLRCLRFLRTAGGGLRSFPCATCPLNTSASHSGTFLSEHFIEDKAQDILVTV